MKVKVIRDLSGLPDSSEEIFERASQESMFFSKEWFENYENEIIKKKPGERIYCFEDDGGRLLGLLPLHENHETQYKIKASVLSGMANYYTSLFGIVCENIRHEEEIAKALCEKISAEKKQFDLLSIRPLAEDSIFYNKLADELACYKWEVQKYFCFGNWYLKSEGLSYEVYLKARPSKLKNNIRRKTNQFFKSNGRLELIDSDLGLEKGIADYESVYNSSWKVTEPYPNFIRELIRYSARNGELRLGVAYLEEKPIAAQIWFVSNEIASIFKLAYDEEYKKISAGTVLTAFIMAHVLDEDKVKEVDYLTGDDPYKKEWMSDRRERWGLLAYNKRTLVGRLLGLVSSLKAYIKNKHSVI